MALENKERYKKKMIIFKRENSNFESRPSRRPRNKVQKKIIVKEVIPNHIINQMKEFLKGTEYKICMEERDEYEVFSCGHNTCKKCSDQIETCPF